MCLFVIIFYFWVRINWLLMLILGKWVIIDFVLVEGDFYLLSLDVWFYYGKLFLNYIFLFLLIILISGLIFYLIWFNKK